MAPIRFAISNTRVLISEKMTGSTGPRAVAGASHISARDSSFYIISFTPVSSAPVKQTLQEPGRMLPNPDGYTKPLDTFIQRRHRCFIHTRFNLLLKLFCVLTGNCCAWTFTIGISGDWSTKATFFVANLVEYELERLPWTDSFQKGFNCLRSQDLGRKL